jgi:orotidine-5'-phosphate decarboxylase
MNARDRLIIALDHPDKDSTLRLIAKTKEYAGTYKVGLGLFCAFGPTIVKEIKSLGVEVFLDLKLHDIPMQVAKAIEFLLHLEVKFLTIHASGGLNMLKAAKQAALGSKTTLLAVSILTSINDSDYSRLFLGNINDGVTELAKMSFAAGINSLVCSPLEAKSLKSTFGDDCFLVVPGIRSSSNKTFDQARTLTAFDAIVHGANALVVGRPITNACDVYLAAKNLHDEIKTAL